MTGSTARAHLCTQIEAEYRRRFPHSSAASTAGPLLGGTSHGLRSNWPFMVVAARARGASFVDLDGHETIDYWQGHYANLLGHHPPAVTAAIAAALEDGPALQSGLVHALEAEVAELVCRQVRMDALRFTTSGTLASMYAVMLARAVTGRPRLIKVRGGWHGGQPFGLKGVTPGADGTFGGLESEGLPTGIGEDILLTRFNDVEQLADLFARHDGEIACLLVEPVLGAGGAIAATTEYLREARRLSQRHGALLVADEVITGFRFRAGDVCTAYGVQPDLLVLGKILGGGMPVACLAGRRELIAACVGQDRRVRFDGGTYAGHGLSLVAARAMLRVLIEDEARLYPALAAAGERLRAGLQDRAAGAGLPLAVTGALPDGLPGSSLAMLHPLAAPVSAARCPEDLAAPALRHPVLDDVLLKSLFLLEGISVSHGLGAISAAHDGADLERTLSAFERVLDRLPPGSS
jgi:glutamate-1-semialdehyde 2,1-aminomutase